MNRQEKDHEIELLSAQFQATRHAFLVGFQGLTVDVDTALRSELRKANIRYKVVKNTLARRAAKGTALEPLHGKFVGPTAVVINPDDPVTVAKLVAKFQKDHPKFVFKAGVLEGKLIEAKDLDTIATLPPREELLSKIMFLINCNAQRLATTLNGVARNLTVVVGQIRDQKQEA